MTTLEDEEAAWLIFTMSRSLPPWTKQSVVEAIEREERVFILVPRKKRSLRVPIASSSSMTKENLEVHVHGPLIESPTKHIRTDRRLAGGASSSGTREPTPEWLVRLIISKNGDERGGEPKKLIEKDLTATDLSSYHGRLSMPFSSIVDLDFLSPTEEKIIQEHVKKVRTKGLDAKLVSSDLREFNVNLRRWNMKKGSGSFTPVYNLVTGWNQVVQDCRLKEKDKIRLWSFHSNGQLYFALVPPTPPPPPSESKSEKISSALVIYDKSNDDLPRK